MMIADDERTVAMAIIARGMGEVLDESTAGLRGMY
jgi:hypothetical protein